MAQSLTTQSGGISLWKKILACVWIFLVVCIYLVLFTPPELVYFIQRAGYFNVFQELVKWLQPYFSADYLS